MAIDDTRLARVFRSVTTFPFNECKCALCTAERLPFGRAFECSMPLIRLIQAWNERERVKRITEPWLLCTFTPRLAPDVYPVEPNVQFQTSMHPVELRFDQIRMRSVVVKAPDIPPIDVPPSIEEVRILLNDIVARPRSTSIDAFLKHGDRNGTGP